MILSNSEILKAINDGFIDIDPRPKAPSLSDSPFNTTALDLRLGNYISIPIEGSPHAFDLRKGNIANLLSTVYKGREIDPDGGFNLNPGQFAIANTLEVIRLRLPTKPGTPCYAARVEGRSSYARCGLMVHFTAPTIHAGWEGNITLELINLGKNSICFFRGMYICQIIFEKVEGEIYLGPSGQFQGQSTPEGKK